MAPACMYVLQVTQILWKTVSCGQGEGWTWICGCKNEEPDWICIFETVTAMWAIGKYISLHFLISRVGTIGFAPRVENNVCEHAKYI